MVKFKFWESNAGRVFETPGLKGDNAQLEEEEGNSKNDLDIIWFHHRIKKQSPKEKDILLRCITRKIWIGQ